MVNVYMSRLQEIGQGFASWWDPWGHGVTEEAIRRGSGVEWRRSDSWKTRTGERHVRRVRYFVRHPEKIDPICVDNMCSGPYIYAVPVLVDGWHRYLAARVLGWEKIQIAYGGRIDVLEYLQGTTDTPPPDLES